MNIWAMIQNGIVVNTVTAASGDPKSSSYIWVDITDYNPRPGIGWATTDNVNFTPPNVPTLPLNQQYGPAQFGQILINQFTASNIQRGMTSDQLFTLASNLSPYYILLQCGSLQSFLDNLPNVPVDGVMITTAIIAQMQGAVQAYLAGD